VPIGPYLVGYAAFLEICEIELDSSHSKGFVMLTFDTTRNYTETNRSRPRQRSGPIAPSTASATPASGSGVSL
jgi:hypothetical protein